MYSAMNKYFLKLEKGNGAYNDMTRLPAFIPLFCSSSEDDAERERLWALQCLRDSFLEGYNMVASCHAPDLLLTTLGRSRLDESERQLILQVLTRLLQFGDLPATHHLLNRVGLLSWLRAFLASNTLQDTTSVFDLVTVAVQQGIKYSTEDQRYQLMLDLRNLLVPLAPMHGVSCIFCLVAESLSDLGYTETMSPAGVSIATSISLLQSSTDKKRMLEAICRAPLNLQGDEASVSSYCETIVRQLLEFPHAETSVVLRRVCHLAKYASPTLLPLVLDTHKRAVRTDAYRQCLAALLEGRQDEKDEWVTVASKIVGYVQDDAKQPKK